MEFFALILTFLFLVVGYGLVRRVFLLSKSKTLVQQAKPFEQAGEPSAPRFLFVGDSTAVGVGSASPNETVAGYFGADFPDRTIVNLSKSGRKTEENIAVLKYQSDQSFDWVFVQIGGNDILYFTNDKELGGQIQEVLREAKRVGKHTVLITSGNVGLAPFFPKALAPFWTNKTLVVREMFRNAADKEGALYVDLFQPRETDLFSTDIPRFYSGDFLHPSGAGYRHWYKQIRETIRQKGWEETL